MTQLSNVLITDNSTIKTNYISVINTSDNCVFSKADLRAISLKLDPKLRNWSEMLVIQSVIKEFPDCTEFVIRCAAFKTESHVSLGNLFFVCFQGPDWVSLYATWPFWK